MQQPPAQCCSLPSLAVEAHNTWLNSFFIEPICGLSRPALVPESTKKRTFSMAACIAPAIHAVCVSTCSYQSLPCTGRLVQVLLDLFCPSLRVEALSHSGTKVKALDLSIGVWTMDIW
mmetsp:Transcript_14248/g.26701  ORF Transcript_14248/g.26701 Transcript_14248/m.26701 type:complete len:118 (-) Transcript_14248:62-415(-)